MRAAGFRGGPSRTVPVTAGFEQRRATTAQMWDGFPLAGPGIVFFADFGGDHHRALHADGGQCRSMCLLPVPVPVPVPVLWVADWLLYRGVVGLWF